MTGICTCGNAMHQTHTKARLITEHSEPDLDLILGTNKFRDLPTTLKENIRRSVKSRDPILLDASKDYEHQINELALWLDYKWPIGRPIKTKFIHHDSSAETVIRQTVVEWEKYANIKFEFVTSGDAEIRISFRPDGTSWSKIGSSCLDVGDQSVPTMNFGVISTSMPEFRAVILHEFGHALGCVHEHQSPASSILWDEQRIMRIYTSAVKQKESWVRSNILNSFPQTEVTNSRYDSLSIMHYWIDATYTKNGYHVDANYELSQVDKKFIGTCYPFHRQS